MNHQRFGWHEDRPNMGRDEFEQGRYPRQEYGSRGSERERYGQPAGRGTNRYENEDFGSSGYYGGQDREGMGRYGQGSSGSYGGGMNYYRGQERDDMGRFMGRSGYEDRYSQGSSGFYGGGSYGGGMTSNRGQDHEDMGWSPGRSTYGREGYFGRTRGWGYSDMDDYGQRSQMGRTSSGYLEQQNGEQERDSMGRFTSGGTGGRGRGMRGPHSGIGPKNYQRSDERIREDVSDRLEEDGYLNASEIEVKVKDGLVMLTGTVDTREEKRRAEECAETCPGVKDVQNQLRVSHSQQRESGTKQNDTQHNQGGNRKSA